MEPTRRALLTSTLALAACRPDGSLRVVGRPRHSGADHSGVEGDTAPTGDTGTPAPPPPTGPGPEPPFPWDPPGDEDLDRFPCGVQTGDALPTAVLVSVRTDEPVVGLALALGVEDGWQDALSVEALAPEDGVLQVELDGLVPDSTYSVVITVRAEGVRSSVARFRTALPPGASRPLRIGATSCLGSPGAPWRNLSRVAEQKLDVFLLLGDTIYADEGLLPAGRWDEKWADALATEGLRAVTASTSVVATWDDHEVDNDWSWDAPGMPQDALDALAAFRRSIPMRDGPGGSLLWRKLSWGDAVDLFVLDCRGERRGGDYVSPEQMAWLKDGLSTSTARFKLILNSVPITDMDAVYLGIGAEDRWDGHPAQRSEILDHVADRGLTGVLWVAGDFHWGAVATVGRPGTRHEAQREVFCGPSGSVTNPLAAVARAPQFDPVVARWNAVVFELDPAAGTVRVVFEGNEGPLAERVLTL
jgi:phosphodiesterase/alkaline phosphatase D-like protein